MKDLNSEKWINSNTKPNIFRRIEITDGNIADTGFYLGGNWYMDNNYSIMGEIKFWRYVD